MAATVAAGAKQRLHRSVGASFPPTTPSSYQKEMNTMNTKVSTLAEPEAHLPAPIEPAPLEKVPLHDRILQLETRLATLEKAQIELQGDLPDNRVSLVVFSGDLDKVLASFVIATGAAAVG